MQVVVKPPSEPPSTRSRSRPSRPARTVSEAVPAGGSVSASATSAANEAGDGGGTWQQGSGSRARHQHTSLLARQQSIGGGLLGVANAKSFRSSKLAGDEDDGNVSSTPTAAVDASTRGDGGAVCISGSARMFLMNVQGFNQSKGEAAVVVMAWWGGVVVCEGRGWGGWRGALHCTRSLLPATNTTNTTNATNATTTTNATNTTTNTTINTITNTTHYQHPHPLPPPTTTAPHHHQAAVDATALAVLPNNYMKKYPSFTQKDKMAQMELGTGATAGLTLATLRQAASAAMPKFADIMSSIVSAAGLEPDEVATHNGKPLVLVRRRIPGLCTYRYCRRRRRHHQQQQSPSNRAPTNRYIETNARARTHQSARARWSTRAPID